MKDFLGHYNIELGNEQQEIVEKYNTQALLFGCSGSGKTLAYLTRIAYMLEHEQVDVDTMLNLTSNEDGVHILENKYQTLFPDHTHTPVFKTVAQYAYEVLKAYQSEHGIATWSLCLDTKSFVRTMVYDDFGMMLDPEELVYITSRLQYVKQMMLSTKEIEEIHYRGIVFPALYKSYENYKKKHELFDEADVIHALLNLVSKHNQVRVQLQAKLHYLHVDEAQELSLASHMLLRALYHDDMVFCMMVNPYQVLQRCQGAYPEAFADFKKTYQDYTRYDWTQSYYANAQCSDAFNTFVRLLDSNKIQGNAENQEPIILKAFADINRLYSYVEKVVETKDAKATIVYRNCAFVIPLLDTMDKNNVPCGYLGSWDAFFEHPVILDLCAYLSLIHNPLNVEAFTRIYKKMRLDISDKIYNEVLTIMQEDATMDVYEALIRSSLKATRKKELASQIELIRLADKKGTLFALTIILSKLHYDVYLKTAKSSSLDPHVLVLKVLAQRYDDIESFIQRMGELASLQQDHHGDIQIMPITMLAGRGCDSLYVLDCVKSVFPTKHPSPERYMHERALFATCLSHVKKHLEIFSFRKVCDVPLEVSPFLFEIHKKETNTASAHREPPKRLTSVQLKPKTKIVHQTLGEGIIDKVSDGMITVHFASGDVKSLNIKLCLKNELIALCV